MRQPRQIVTHRCNRHITEKFETNALFGILYNILNMEPPCTLITWCQMFFQIENFVASGKKSFLFEKLRRQFFEIRGWFLR